MTSLSERGACGTGGAGGAPRGGPREAVTDTGGQGGGGGRVDGGGGGGGRCTGASVSSIYSS